LTRACRLRKRTLKSGRMCWRHWQSRSRAEGEKGKELRTRRFEKSHFVGGSAGLCSSVGDALASSRGSTAQALLIHVGTPNLGRIQRFRVSHRIKIPAIIRTSRHMLRLTFLPLYHA
jgi:hypothetical protein